MKKNTLIYMLIVILICTSLGQAQQSQKTFSKGIWLSQGSLGLVSTGIYGNVKVPPINFVIEYANDNNWGINFLGGYGSSKEDYGGYGFEYSYLLLGVGASYHFDFDINNVDIYGRFFLGYVNVSASTFGFGVLNLQAKGSFFGYGSYLGAIYYLSPNFGVHGDVGYGSLAALRLGVTLKL